MDKPQTQETMIKIEDVVDITLLQRLQDTFAQAMGVAAVTVDRNGIPITETSNFRTVCNMIRSTKTGLARCQKCDADGGRIALERGAPYAYQCTGGLMDAAAPIIIDGQYAGCILCGQVITEGDQEKIIQDVLDRNLPLGLPPKEFENALRDMAPLSRDRFQAAVEMLSLTANNIIEKGAANMAQAQLLQEAQERVTLQAALQETQLKALKAQINPHFLFNSLTLLSYTALEEGAPRTEEIAYTLSDLLRYSLRNISSSVELGEEVEMIHQYLAIQKIRFGERLESHVMLDPELERFEIPCMILQPLVENAIIHGAEPLTRLVKVTVKAYKENGRLILEVADNGRGMSPELVETIQSGNFAGDGQSLGLQNVLQRLQNEYRSRLAITVQSARDYGTQIRFTVDLKSEETEPVETILDLNVPAATQMGHPVNLNQVQAHIVTPLPVPINNKVNRGRNNGHLSLMR